jgi:hypothetical protein
MCVCMCVCVCGCVFHESQPAIKQTTTRNNNNNNNNIINNNNNKKKSTTTKSVTRPTKPELSPSSMPSHTHPCATAPARPARPPRGRRDRRRPRRPAERKPLDAPRVVAAQRRQGVLHPQHLRAVLVNELPQLHPGLRGGTQSHTRTQHRRSCPLPIAHSQSHCHCHCQYHHHCHCRSIIMIN